VLAFRDLLRCYELDGRVRWERPVPSRAPVVGHPAVVAAPRRLAVVDADGSVRLVATDTGAVAPVELPPGAVLLPERGRILVAVADDGDPARVRVADLSTEPGDATSEVGTFGPCPVDARPLALVADRLLLRRPGTLGCDPERGRQTALLVDPGDAGAVGSSDPLGAAVAFVGGELSIGGETYLVTGLGERHHPLRLWRLPALSAAARLPPGQPLPPYLPEPDHHEPIHTVLPAVPPSCRPRPDAAGRPPVVTGRSGLVPMIVTGGPDGTVRRWDVPPIPAAPTDDDPRRHDEGVVLQGGGLAAVPTREPLVACHAQVAVPHGGDLKPLFEVSAVEPSSGRPVTFAQGSSRRRAAYPRLRSFTVDGRHLVLFTTPFRTVACLEPDASPGQWERDVVERADWGTTADCVVTSYPGAGPVLVSIQKDGRDARVHVERLADGTPVREPADLYDAAEVCRLTLLEGRAVVVKTPYPGEVSARYAYGLPDDVVDDEWVEWISGRELELPGGTPGSAPGSDAAWSGRLLDVDDRGRLLVEGRRGTVWRYDLASLDAVGPPITVRGPQPTAARYGSLHGRDVLAVLTPMGLGLYDVATQRQRANLVLGTPVWDAVVVAPDTVVVLTENGLTGLRVSPGP
jgi:hypothetical protein